MAACAILVTCVLWNVSPGHPRPLWMRAALVLIAVDLRGLSGRAEVKKNRGYVLSARNFYGVLRVRDDPESSLDVAHAGADPRDHQSRDSILGPGAERIATSYFGRDSGISRAIRALGEAGPIAHRRSRTGRGRDGHAGARRAIRCITTRSIRWWLRSRNREFGFFRACPADKQLFLGDGRLVLERMPDENLDFLAMDAFSSDAVPVHLLTREAYATYQRHLKPGGVLAINISNRYLDLEPVVAQAASDWAGPAWWWTMTAKRSLIIPRRRGF